jgi:histidine triad (HIT) family protein
LPPPHRGIADSEKEEEMRTVFGKILSGEVPCHKIWEDEDHLAFLDIRPLQPGHCLLIPKKEHDYIFDVPSSEYRELWAAASKVSALLKQATGCRRVAIIAAGYEVAHCHIHLIPTNAESDIIPPVFTHPTPEELSEVAESIRGAGPIQEAPKLDRIRARWDEFAEDFQCNFEPITRRLARSAMEHLEIEKATALLEVGCGAGGAAVDLFRLLPEDAQMEVCDLSLQMLALARERLDDRITVMEADAQELPYDDATFDRLFSNLSLMIVPDPARALAEAARVLKPGARAVWTVWGRPDLSPMMTLLPQAARNTGLGLPPPGSSNFRLGSIQKLKGMLEEAGFENIALWYQPMLSTAESGAEFADMCLVNRPELAQQGESVIEDLRAELERLASKHFAIGSPIALDVLIARADKA